MRKFLMVCGLVLLACLVMAAGEHKQIAGSATLTHQTDTLSDSTVVTGSVPIHDPWVEGYTGIMAQFVLSGPRTAYAGVGNDDSAWMWLRSTWAGRTILLDSVICSSLPCSLYYASAKAAAGADTLLREKLLLDYTLYDSCADTSVLLEYRVSYDINLK